VPCCSRRCWRLRKRCVAAEEHSEAATGCAATLCFDLKRRACGNRPAGRPPRGAVLLILIYLPHREAERRFCGVGRPAWMPGEPRWAMDGPWRRAHGAGPERGNLSAAKAVRQGQGLFGSFCGCLTKGTRRKGETIFRELDTNAGYVLGYTAGRSLAPRVSSYKEPVTGNRVFTGFVLTDPNHPLGPSITLRWPATAGCAGLVPGAAPAGRRSGR
jgi:hypothetical protein